MKKIILTIFITIMIILIPNVKATNLELPEKTDHEKVKIYLFWMSTCAHCHDFIEYFGDKYTIYEDYFEIVTYQVDGNEDNSELLKSVGRYLNYDEDKLTGVPLIVVGEEHQRGFGSDGTDIINMALDAYKDDNYEDIVEKVKNDEELNAISKDFLSACSTAGITCKNKEAKKMNDGVVIGIIFGILIFGFGGLILYSKKSEE